MPPILATQETMLAQQDPALQSGFTSTDTLPAHPLLPGEDHAYASGVGIVTAIADQATWLSRGLPC